MGWTYSYKEIKRFSWLLETAHKALPEGDWGIESMKFTETSIERYLGVWGHRLCYGPPKDPLAYFHLLVSAENETLFWRARKETGIIKGKVMSLDAALEIAKAAMQRVEELPKITPWKISGESKEEP